MKKKYYWAIICSLAIIIVILCGILFVVLNHNSQNRTVFINHMYFRLVDIDKDLELVETGELDNLNRVAEKFSELDLMCDMQSVYTNNSFYYFPGQFRKIAENMQLGKYSAEELKQLRENIQATIEELSTASGKGENDKLTYRQVSEILKNLFLKLEENVQNLK
ncbi:MAG: hypothetical protein ACI4TK_03930 [Agathobacter sp.]